jgi:drug/metabolite transporter (DMT)-like permease
LGEKHIASGLAGVLNATPSIFVLLITMATSYGAQRVTAQKIVGAGFGLAGVLVTVGVESLRDFNTAAPLAQAAVLGASLCYALAPMWGQRFGAPPPVVTAAGAMSCAALMLLPAALIIERPWTLVPAPDAIAAVIVLARAGYGDHDDHLFSSGANAWCAWNCGSYLRAGFSVALGTLFLGESFTWSTFAGMALIVVGVVAVTARPRTKSRSDQIAADLKRMRRQRAEREHRDCGDSASKREGMNSRAAASGQGTGAQMQPGFRREFA